MRIMARILWAIIVLLLPFSTSAKFTINIARPRGNALHKAAQDAVRHSPIEFAHTGFVNLRAYNWEFAVSGPVTFCLGRREAWLNIHSSCAFKKYRINVTIGKLSSETHTKGPFQVFKLS